MERVKQQNEDLRNALIINK
jgi:hypothetical protein